MPSDGDHFLTHPMHLYLTEWSYASQIKSIFLSINYSIIVLYKSFTADYFKNICKDERTMIFLIWPYFGYEIHTSAILQNYLIISLIFASTSFISVYLSNKFLVNYSALS